MLANSISVKIFSYQGDVAKCRAGFRGEWHPIDLDKKSLDSLDLRLGDSFYWIPRKKDDSFDIKLKEEDLITHPRRLNRIETERALRCPDFKK